MLGKSLQKLKKILISKNLVLFAFFQLRKSGLLFSNPLESCNMDGGS